MSHRITHQMSTRPPRRAVHSGNQKGRRETPTTPMHTLVQILKQHRLPLSIALVLSVIEAAIGLVQPLVINMTVDRIGKQPIAGPVAILLGLLLLNTVVSAAQNYLLGSTAESAVYRTRLQLIARILRLPIRRYDEQRSGDLVTRLGSDTTLVRTAVSGGLINSLSSVLTIVGAIVMMALLDVLMLAIVLGVTVATMAVMISVSSLIQKHTKATQKAIGELGADTERALGAIRTVRANNAQRRVNRELDAQARDAYDHSIAVVRLQSMLGPLAGVSMQLSFMAVLGVGGARVATGQMSVGDLVSFVLFLFMVAMPMGQLFQAITTIRSAMGALERINEVLDTPAEPLAGEEADLDHGSVEFQHVEFSYDPDRPRSVLDGVSFHVRAGSMTALVGPSGSGKSTSLALIERFYDPTGGRILIDGIPTTNMSRTAIRHAVGYVEQDAPVMAGTVRYNLHLANPRATDSECRRALERVNLTERFAATGGLDTKLGDRGVSLSGGERQRLALARLLLTDARILLLDEPTAAVDSQNEQLILDAIAATAQDRTLIVVAHRLSTVTDADQLVVFDHGRVDSIGRHEELLQSSELYRDLARRQLLG